MGVMGEQDMQERVSRAKEALKSLQDGAILSLRAEVSDILEHKTLRERVQRLEYYLTVVGSCVAGPLMTPHMTRDIVRDELKAFTAETAHNQNAYHAVVNVAYTRSRQLLDILDALVAIAPEIAERLEPIRQDYQREINDAIATRLEAGEIVNPPTEADILERLA